MKTGIRRGLRTALAGSLLFGGVATIALAVLAPSTAMASEPGSSARSVAAALVADFQSGKVSPNICSLAPPSVRSKCKSEVKGELDGTHPSFPHVRLSSVRVTGNNANIHVVVLGRPVLRQFHRPQRVAGDCQAKWEVVSRLQLRQFRELRTLSQLRLG